MFRSGLGSSASFWYCLNAYYSTAIATGGLVLAGLVQRILTDQDLEKINQLAFELETMIHGLPSGKKVDLIY